MNGNKIILDLCGGTGSWSKPYRDAGYDVHVITLPELDVTDVKITDDEIEFPVQGKFLDSKCLIIKNIYGILAAPPCTEFSLAKGGAKRDFATGLAVVNACLKIIQQCRLHNSKLKFWAMENPRGFLRQFVGKPAYTFEQWEFGDCGIKPTDLWGYFNSPKKTVSDKPNGLSYKYPNGRLNAKNWSVKGVKCSEGLNRAAMRAITPPSFANAFFKANK